MKKNITTLCMAALLMMGAASCKKEDSGINKDNPVVNEDNPQGSLENGHKFVDLGLSVKWATCNVGAANPWDYGDYFAWGETEPYYATLSFSGDEFTGTWKSGKTAGYDWASYPYTSGSTSTEIGTQPYTNNVLNLTNDAARANWGGSWRMPTEAELYELIDSCTWTWTTQNGVSGYSVSRNGYTGSIFLPAAGYFNGTSRDSAGTYGNYWSATRGSGRANNAYSLNFLSGSQA